MTTVITDGKSMAADGLSHDRAGTVCQVECEKIRRLADGRIVGLAGTPFDLDAFCKWLEDGGDMPQVEEDFDGLVLERDGQAYAYNRHGRRTHQLLPAGVGSGMDLAIGAVMAGATVEEAVAISIQRHTGSGGKIKVLHLNDGSD